MKKNLFLVLLALLLSAAAPQAPRFSWLALRTELELAKDVPWRHSQLLGSHNAYNERGDVNWQNQLQSISWQLDRGVRVFELDLHERPGPDGLWRVMACHGLGIQDCLLNLAGSRDYREVLQEIRIWSGRNPDQVIILELENRVNDQQAVLGPLQAIFGDLIYRADERPAQWLDETPRQILAKGKRIIVADYGPLRFDGKLVWDQNQLSSNLSTKSFAQGCRVDGKPMAGGAWGFYDDKTLAINLKPPLDPASIPAYLACGTRYLKLDRIDEPMLAAAQFSWDDGVSADMAGCASMSGPSYRWKPAGCEQNAAFACRNTQGQWRTSKGTGEWQQGEEVCRKAGLTFDVPRTFRQNLDLWENVAAKGDKPVWLNYRLILTSTERNSEANSTGR